MFTRSFSSDLGELPPCNVIVTYAQLSCDKQQAAVVSLNVTDSNSVSISVRFLFSLQSEHVFVSGGFFFF